MDNTDDGPSLDDIGDQPILGGAPAETTSTATETTTEPVQPAAPSTSTTETNAEDGTTPSTTDKPTEQSPASENKGAESTEPLKEGETPKDSNQQYQAWIERQRTRNDVTQKINQEYAPPSEQQLVEQGLSEQEARIEAKLQEVNFAQERSRVAELNAGMRDEAVQVQQQFDIFNPSSPNYDKEFTEQVGDNYKRDARVQQDGDMILNADVPLYDYYQQWYNSYNRGLSRGTQQAQANSEQMLARTENPGGSSSKTTGELSQEEFLAQYGDMPLF